MTLTCFPHYPPLPPLPWAAVRRRSLRLAGLALAVALLTAPSAAQDGEPLRVLLSGAEPLSYPVYTIGSSRYITVNDASRLFRAIDSSAPIAWDPMTGIYTVTILGLDFTLSTHHPSVVQNRTPHESSGPMLTARGQTFIPLGSIQIVLRNFDNIQTNLPVDGPAVSQPGADPATDPVTGLADRLSIPESLPDLPGWPTPTPAHSGPDSVPPDDPFASAGAPLLPTDPATQESEPPGAEWIEYGDPAGSHIGPDTVPHADTPETTQPANWL